MPDRQKSTLNNAAVLVTGGSGFVGKRLVRKLSEEDQTVVCMYHHRLPEPMKNVYPVCSDMSSVELIAAPLRGVETVVHLAWEKGLVGPAENIHWDLKSAKLPRNIILLRNLIKAMEKAQTRRLIFVSAIGANRRASSPFLQEKYLAEFFILNSRIPQKIILRTTVVSDGQDLNDKFMRSIVNVMKFPGIYPVPASKSILAPLHLNDLVRVLMRLIDVEMHDFNADVIEMVGGEMIRIDELFKMVSHKYVKGARLALKGFMGDSLLPLFERPSKKDPDLPKLKDFLALGIKLDETTTIENPLIDILPKKYTSLKDILKVEAKAV